MKSNIVKTVESVRLDKWLWAARFYKTRSIARDMVQGGKVQYNGQKTKPGRNINVGDTVRLRQGFDDKTIIITQILDKRQSAPLAQLMYTETPDSIEKRTQNMASRQAMGHNPRPENRPDKKQRRQLIKLKYSE